MSGDVIKNSGAGLAPAPPINEASSEEESDYYENWDQSFESEEEWFRNVQFFSRVGRNFKVEVLAEIEVHTSVDVEYHVNLQLYFWDGQTAIITIPLSEIDRIDWYETDRRCILNPRVPRVGKNLATRIKIALNQNVPKRRILRLDRTGIFNVDGRIIYVAGDKIIGSLSDRVIIQSEGSIDDVELAPSQFQLDIDPNLTMEEAFEGMAELISLSEIGRPLLAHAISGITRSAYTAAGATPSTTLEIVEGTGKFKTYYSATVTQLYNRADGVEPVTRLDSTDSFIENLLHQYSECTVVVDDRCTAASSKIKRKNDETAEKIMRQVGEKIGRGKMSGNTRIQLKPRGNLVITGEHPTGAISTIARGLMVSPTRPIDSERLDKYQRREPLIISTFYYYFIEWYVSNYNEICTELFQRLTRHREKVPKIHPRLWETQFSLQSAFMLFLQFCEASGFITAEEARNEYLDFGTQLAELVQAQNARINPDKEESKKINYLKIIRKQVKNGSIRYAENKKQYLKNPNNYDGLIHYGCLCLRRDKLEKRIRDVVREGKINDAIQELLERNALKLVQEKYQVKINGVGNFYAIWLEMLND